MDGNASRGTSSPRTGGRDDRPPADRGAGSVPAVSTKRWIPPRCVNREDVYPKDRNDETFRRVRGILNKLTPEKFDKLSLELLNVGIDSHLILQGIILLIFEKALDEPKYSTLYAQLCNRLCEDTPTFEPPNSEISTFRRLLLNKCKDEFENRSCATDAFDRRDAITDEDEEQYHLSKSKMLGNIKFIGELGKLGMLHESILHGCIKQLLEKKRNNISVQDVEEDLECLCKIMSTTGYRLDTPKAKAWMDQYFDRIWAYSENQELSLRMRFMLQDVIELRENDWEPRKCKKDAGPRTITEIRQQGGEVSVRPGMLTTKMMNGGLGRGSVNMDMFSAPNIMGGLGTGPGVIPLDGFISGYSTNMGRNMGRNIPFNAGGGGGGRGGGGRGGYRQYDNRDPDSDGQDGMGSPRMGNQKSNDRNSPVESQQQYKNKPYSPQPGQYRQDKTNSPGGMKELPPRFQKMNMASTSPSAPGGLHPNQDSGGGGGAPNTGPPPGMAMMLPMMMNSANPAVNPTSGPISTTSTVSNKDMISLRPKNMMLKPNAPNMLPKSAQLSQSSALGGSYGPDDVARPPIPNPLKQTPLPMKQVTVEKKVIKRQVPTKKETMDNAARILTQYLEGESLDQTIAALKDLLIVKKYVPDVLTLYLKTTLDKSDDDREKMMQLIVDAKPQNLIASDYFMEAFTSLLDQLSSLETEVPLIKSCLAQFAAHAVSGGVISLAELAPPLQGGSHHPLFLLCLQQMHRIKNKDWLVQTFNESKVDLQKMLPELDRDKERMMAILEDRGLSFMFPLLRIQSELWRHIQLEPTASAVYKWIREKVDTELQHTDGFVITLSTCLIRYITSESTLCSSIDQPAARDKVSQEKEKILLDKLKGVLQKFVNDSVDLQVAVLHAVQVFCYNQNFPKGMLLRFFMNLYDLDILEEQAFMQWKEDINDAFPGKGTALFQVNQWLTWLEQAEDESEDDD